MESSGEYRWWRAELRPGESYAVKHSDFETALAERPLGALPIPLVPAEHQHLPIELLLRGHLFGGEGAETIDIFLGGRHFLFQAVDFDLLDLDFQGWEMLQLAQTIIRLAAIHRQPHDVASTGHRSKFRLIDQRAAQLDPIAHPEALRLFRQALSGDGTLGCAKVTEKPRGDVCESGIRRDCAGRGMVLNMSFDERLIGVA